MAKHRFFPHIDHKKRFANYPEEKHESVFWRSLLMCVQAWLHSHRGYAEQLASWVTPLNNEVQKRPLSSMEPRITWVGHSTFLIQVAGINILTDPVFFNLPLFKRITPPGLDLQDLPPIHAVIISHNHYDHMEAATLKALFNHPTCTFYVPQGDRAWFERRGCSRVMEFMWWDRVTITPHESNLSAVTLTFLPAFHWSGRGLFDRNTSLWGSWMIEVNDMFDARRIYFGGDSAYGRHFKAIAQEFPSIDIALLPIGPCEPRQWMKLSHLGPEEAGQAFLELNARHFIPMHWATYWFGVDTPFMPMERLNSWWHDNQDKLTDVSLHLLKIGEAKDFGADVLRTPVKKVPTLQLPS